MPRITDDTPIVVFGDDWRRNVSTLQHLFFHLIAHRPIVWVNSFGHRAPQLTVYDIQRAARKVRMMLMGYRVPADGRPAPARIIEPRALPWHNIAAIRSLNTWSLVRDVRRALAQVAPGRAPLLITGTPAAVGVVGALGEIASVYFCMDDYGELPGVDADIVAPLEKTLLRRVDATVATARALVELKRPTSGLAYALPQGVNYDHFARAQPEPADMAQLPHPRIGFAGGISSACDFGLIRALAEAHPTGSIVLVGPVQAGVEVPRLSNVHLLGHRPYDVLPAYVQAFDVGLIPYVLNDWTRSVDPLKLLEYLAAGIPVVSTAIPEVEKYADAICIGADTISFLACVAEALEGSRAAKAERGQSVARAHTWARRAEQLMQIVQDVVDRRATPATARAG
jgi:glycosyltransferase involved in cell wall biosynthesis